MLPRLFTPIFFLILLLGCSSPESRDRLPSQSPTAKAPAQPAVSTPSTTLPKPQQTQNVTLPKVLSKTMCDIGQSNDTCLETFCENYLS